MAWVDIIGRDWRRVREYEGRGEYANERRRRAQRERERQRRLEQQRWQQWQQWLLWQQQQQQQPWGSPQVSGRLPPWERPRGYPFSGQVSSLLR